MTSINYKEIMQKNRKESQDLSDEDLGKLFRKLLSDKHVFATVANVLINNGEELLKSNLEFQHTELLLRGGASCNVRGVSDESESTRRNLLIVQAIQVGNIMSNMASSLRAKVFAENYKK